MSIEFNFPSHRWCSSGGKVNYNALELADKGSWNALVTLFAGIELTTIMDTESLAKEPAKRQEWINRLSKAANEKESNAQSKRYLVWKACAENFITEIRTCCEELSNSSDHLKVHPQIMHFPNHDKWEAVARGDETEILVASLKFEVADQEIDNIALFLSPHERSDEDLFEYEHELVSFGLESTDPGTLSISNLVYVESNLFVYEVDPMSGLLACADDLSVGDVVAKVFENTFMLKGGLGA